MIQRLPVSSARTARLGSTAPLSIAAHLLMSASLALVLGLALAAAENQPATRAGAAGALSAEAVPVLAPDATTFTLDNGLTVVVVPDHRAPVVTHMVYYKIGSSDERPGQSGIAHFLEHLMFKGTSNHPGSTLTEAVVALGADQNAFTTNDYTFYFQTVVKEYLRDVMALEADRMANLSFPEDVVAAERSVILEERSSRIDTVPDSILTEALLAVLFRNSPYGRPVLGWRHEMEKLDGALAYEYYNRYYTPNNAILVVAGDVTGDDVRAFAAETYGRVVRRAQPPPRNWPTEPPSLTRRTVTLHDARVTQPSVSINLLTPSYTQGDRRASLALDLLADILGGGSTSRLYRSLVLDQGLAVSAVAIYSGAWIGDGRFVVAASPKSGHTLDEVIVALEAVMAGAKDKGVTDEELAIAKERVLAGAILAQDGPGNMARLFGSGLAIGRTLEEIKTYPSLIQTVTLDEVNAAARAYLDVRSAVIGRLEGPAASGGSQ